MSKKRSNNQSIDFNKPIRSFEPKTANQADYVRCISENIITICYGCAGTGKSFIATAMASHYLQAQMVEKILITRTLVGCGKEFGHLPGTLEEKLYEYVTPYMEYLNLFLGKSRVTHYINSGDIVFSPVELVRGHTYDYTFMIAEECQNMTPQQCKLLISRIGKKSKLVMVGDNRQSDIYNSGFNFCIEKLADIKDVGIAKLEYQDILRNSILAHVLEKFDLYNI